MSGLDPTWHVPEFETIEFNVKRSKYCVCVFVLNEGEKFDKQMARMQHLNERIDLVVADGGSTDGCTEPDTLRTTGVNTLLIKKGAGRLGAQMRMAFGWALARGYEGVVVIDGNNKDSVDDIPKFTALLDRGYDFLQGSRFLPGGHHENTPISRLLGVKLIHAPVLSWLAGFQYSDTTNGFRAYSAKFLEDQKVALFRDVFDGYELHYYLAVKAPRLGYACSEVPVSRVYPKSGPVPTKISPVSGNLGILRKLVSVAVGRYDR